MSKNTIVIAINAVLVLLLLAGLVSTRKALQEMAVSPGEYGGLLALREVLAPADYQNIVMPYLEKAAKGQSLTRADMQAIASQLPQLPQQLYDLAAKPSLSSNLNQALDSVKNNAESWSEDLRQSLDAARNSAGELGAEVGEALKEGLDTLRQDLDDLLNKMPSRSSSNSSNSLEGATEI